MWRNMCNSQQQIYRDFDSFWALKLNVGQAAEDDEEMIVSDKLLLRICSIIINVNLSFVHVTVSSHCHGVSFCPPPTNTHRLCIYMYIYIYM